MWTIILATSIILFICNKFPEKEVFSKDYEAAIEQVKALGGTPVKVTLPHTKYAVAVYYIVATAEASANLARFDGVRYGRREVGPDGSLQSLYDLSRTHGFGPEVKRRILLGTWVLSSGYYDAYYNRALKVRTLVRRDFEGSKVKKRKKKKEQVVVTIS